jgi:hypothetical protein
MGSDMHLVYDVGTEPVMWNWVYALWIAAAIVLFSLRVMLLADVETGVAEQRRKNTTGTLFVLVALGAVGGTALGFHLRATCQRLASTATAAIEGTVTDVRYHKGSWNHFTFEVGGVWFAPPPLLDGCGFARGVFEATAMHAGDYVRVVHADGRVVKMWKRAGGSASAGKQGT